MKIVKFPLKQFEIDKSKYCIFNGIKIYDNTKMKVLNGYIFPVIKETQNLGSILDIFSSIGSGIADVGVFIGETAYEGIKWTTGALYDSGSFAFDLIKDTGTFLKESSLISTMADLTKSGLSLYTSYKQLTGQTPTSQQAKQLAQLQAGIASGKYTTSIPSGTENQYNAIDLGALGTIYEKKDYTTYYVIGGSLILILIIILFMRKNNA